MKTIAFFLPQFHPVPENNTWWGPGFTEWHNVARARPRFRGHHQPHLPGELGFYDLRCADTQREQAALAHAHGVDAFCYYHYWFGGRQLLERPAQDLLAHPAPAFPFCLCWANESWSRAWDGTERNILVAQTYSDTDTLQHIRHLQPHLTNHAYLRVGEKPLFLFYRAGNIPNLPQVVDVWQREARSWGLPGLHLCAVRSNFAQAAESDLLGAGLDAIVDFTPNVRHQQRPTPWRRACAKACGLVNQAATAMGRRSPLHYTMRMDYRAQAQRAMQEPLPQTHRRYPCVFPSWDNSARRQLATAYQNDDAALFQSWVESEGRKLQSYPPAHQLLFINAWNEWAEGCHLEPDWRMGRAWLEAVRHARQRLDAPAVPASHL